LQVAYRGGVAVRGDLRYGFHVCEGLVQAKFTMASTGGTIIAPYNRDLQSRNSRDYDSKYTKYYVDLGLKCPALSWRARTAISHNAAMGNMGKRPATLMYYRGIFCALCSLPAVSSFLLLVQKKRSKEKDTAIKSFIDSGGYRDVSALLLRCQEAGP